MLNKKNELHKIMEDFVKNDLSKLLGNTFRLDVYETATEYVVEAEMPGFKKEEISVELIDEKLIISTKKEEFVVEEEFVESKMYIHKERKNTMSRSVYLINSKRDEIKATLVDGILTVIVQKDETVKDKYKVDID